MRMYAKDANTAKTHS